MMALCKAPAMALLAPCRPSAESLAGATQTAYQALAGTMQDAVTNSESAGKVHESGTPCEATERDCPLKHKEDSGTSKEEKDITPPIEYRVSPGNEKALPGNLPLYDGYEVNEFNHGEISDKRGLAEFLKGEDVGSVADKTYMLSGSKLKDIAQKVGDDYASKGKSRMQVPPIGEVILDAGGVENSIRHFTQNRKTTPEHKQMVADAFAIVPDVIEKGRLVEYGQHLDNPLLTSYLFQAPIKVGGKDCVMAVRVRKQQGQDSRFYLHGVALLEDLKEKSRSCYSQGSGLGTGNPSGTDLRDVFRVAKKHFMSTTKMNKLRKIISNVWNVILAFVLLCMAASEGEEEIPASDSETNP